MASSILDELLEERLALTAKLNDAVHTSWEVDEVDAKRLGIDSGIMRAVYALIVNDEKLDAEIGEAFDAMFTEKE